MNKQKKQLFLLGILLILLVGGYFGLTGYNMYHDQKEQEQKEVIYVTKLEVAELQEISWQYEEETVSLIKKEEVWISESDANLILQQDTVETMAKAMTSLQAKQIIEGVTDKEQYGLEENARKVTFATEDTTYTCFIGDYNSTSQVYYCGTEKEDIVYVVDESNISCFNYGLEDLLAQ